jgi:hypothetical protein
MQNGFIESFNGRMRDELLNETMFFGLDDARAKIANWVADYNKAASLVAEIPYHRGLRRPHHRNGRTPTSSADRPLLHPRHLAYKPRL